jgi:hypothetical protein
MADRSIYKEICKKHLDWIETGDPRSPFPMFGFEIDAGWSVIIEKLFDDIAAIVRPLGVKVMVRQVKEKFGTLRFYWSAPLDKANDEKVERAVELAEFRSECTCEACGAPGRLVNSGGWFNVACDEHARPGSKLVRRGQVIGHYTSRGTTPREWWLITYDPVTDAVTHKQITEEEYRKGTER